MKYQVEVCIDNIESLHNAIAGGATRIELCSSLALGGLTPSAGLMYSAGRVSPIPVYAMIRPREGDFSIMMMNSASWRRIFAWRIKQTYKAWY